MTDQPDYVTVWKFDIAPIDDLVVLKMPKDARILHIDLQQADPRLWALVDPLAEKEERWFRVVGTGHKFSPNNMGEYVGTFQAWDGKLVWHMFELIVEWKE